MHMHAEKSVDYLPMVGGFHHDMTLDVDSDIDTKHYYPISVQRVEHYHSWVLNEIKWTIYKAAS